MGKIILCRGKRTDKPLLVEGTGIRLYTAEELCYYIYNNIYLLGSEFIDGRLVEFLNSTGQNDLASRVRTLLDKKAGLAEIVVTILKTVDYYSIEEIEKIREILNTLSSQNVCERLKSRGDSFLANECYFNAIKCYETIVRDYRGSDLSGLTYAKVFHNLGVAYARMFLYEQAAENFRDAYSLSQHEESRKCYVAANIMAKRNKGPANDDATEEEYVACREIETLMDNARYSDDYRRLEEIEKLKDEGQVIEYNAYVEDILNNWKSDYLKSSKTF